MKNWTRTAWTQLPDAIDHFAIFDRIIGVTMMKELAAFEAGNAHLVVVTKRAHRPKRFYIDGQRVFRWHPYLRALRGKPYPRKLLGL